MAETHDPKFLVPASVLEDIACVGVLAALVSELVVPILGKKDEYPIAYNPQLASQLQNWADQLITEQSKRLQAYAVKEGVPAVSAE